MTIEEKYKDRKPIGYASDSAFTGILVFEPDSDDKSDDCDFVICEEINGNRQKFHKHRVCYDKKGNAYVSKMQRKWYLNEILRY